MLDILTATGGISGTFASTILPALTGDLFWSIIYGPSRLELAVEAPIPILPGDFNSDGIVDAADYVVWRNGHGKTYAQSDYDVWRTHFVQTADDGAGATASAAVPEPTTLGLLMFATTVWCFRQRQTA
jgi:hypothetical protein